MMLSENQDWTERPFVSIGEAAGIFGRSREWIRDRIVDCSLSTVRLRPGGLQLITTRSARALLAAETTRRAASGQRHSRKLPRLRLIVDNG